LIEILKEGWQEMAKGNQISKTLIVAGLLCFVCSIIVSITVVTLKPKQLRNADLDFKKNVLNAAGMLEAGADIDEEFKKIQTVMVDLESGTITDQVSPKGFDQRTAAANPDYSVKIPSGKDIAGLNMRAKYAKVFLVREGDDIQKIILPISSMGLWARMYGFMAIAGDTKTIEGFAYYQHGETPGLGAEVDNPKWKSQWIGKEVYNDSWEPVAGVKKAITNPDSQVDALSGATITSNGVDTSLKYWFGEHGYAKFLTNIREGAL
jgi:Na+-transporting NADH:ubiquinone oxidoreductase subunit C